MKVRIIDCTGGGRREQAVMELDTLLRYVRDQAGDVMASSLREDLITEGKARVDGEYGWFEYERVE